MIFPLRACIIIYGRLAAAAGPMQVRLSQLIVGDVGDVAGGGGVGGGAPPPVNAAGGDGSDVGDGGDGSDVSNIGDV